MSFGSTRNPSVTRRAALRRLAAPALLVSVSCPLLNRPAGARSPVRSISHGDELDRSIVGPVAAGYGTLQGPYPGTEIRDGRAYPFVREIPVSATYDGYAVSGPHLLIEAVAFDGPLDIYATRPIVFRGVSVRTARAAHWAIHTRPGAGPFHFLWSEAGASRDDGAPGDRMYALARALYLRADNSTVYRSHVSRTADGIQLHAARADIIETLVDDLVYWDKDHNDGIQMLGRGAHVQILRCRIDNRNPQTSCLNLIGDHVRVEACHLAGGGWVVYGGAHAKGAKPGVTRGVVVRDTIFGRIHFPKSGHFGPVAYWDKSPATGNIWQRNRFDDGRSIEP